MLGNRYQAEAAIKEKLGADTIVNHKVAIFFTVVSEVDGKMGKRHCCPGCAAPPAGRRARRTPRAQFFNTAHAARAQLHLLQLRLLRLHAVQGHHGDGGERGRDRRRRSGDGRHGALSAPAARGAPHRHARWQAREP